MTKKQGIWILVLATMLAGCQFGGGDPEVIWEDDAGKTMRERLVRAHTLELDLQDSSVQVDTRKLALEWGRVRLGVAPDGRLKLENVDVRIGSVSFSKADLPPNGLELRDVRVQLASMPSGTPEWTEQGDAAFTALTVDLTLEWSLVTQGGTVSRLAPQTITGVKVDLAVFEAEDGRLTALVSGRKDGPFFEWAGGFITLKDLVVDLRSVE